MNEFDLLLYLASKGKAIETSTNRIAKETKISQQTISRNLIQLDKQGFIQRTVSAQGIIIELKERAESLSEKDSMSGKVRHIEFGWPAA